MSELTIGQLIKIIIGVLVFVVIVIGVGMFFSDRVVSFFQNLGGGELFLGLLK